MTTKITVSLPDKAVAAARKAVREGRSPSVSAYVAEALDSTYGDRPMAQVVAELTALHGAPSDEAYRWATEALDTETP